MKKTSLCAAGAVVLLTALPGAPAALAGPAPDYFSREPAGSKYARAIALNDLGSYAVNSFGPETPYQGAAILGRNMAEDVGSLGGYVTQVRALNNLGQAVGMSTTASGEAHAFLFSGGRMQDLTARYGLMDANDINDRGQISGRTLDDRAALLQGGVLHDFGPRNSGAGAINARGDMLVGYFDPDMGYRTAVYRDGVLSDLPLAGGRRVLGQAINDAGWVTGYFTGANGRSNAVVWDGGTYTNLTPDAASAFGYDINNLGQVVGVADGRAFLYADRALVDLNTRIDRDADLLLISADEINDRTQILAPSCDRAGVFCYGSTLLTPVPGVPEPAPPALLALGLGVLGAAFRLRQVAFTRGRRGQGLGQFEQAHAREHGERKDHGLGAARGQ